MLFYILSLILIIHVSFRSTCYTFQDPEPTQHSDHRSLNFHITLGNIQHHAMRIGKWDRCTSRVAKKCLKFVTDFSTHTFLIKWLFLRPMPCSVEQFCPIGPTSKVRFLGVSQQCASFLRGFWLVHDVRMFRVGIVTHFHKACTSSIAPFILFFLRCNSP